jgi:hypothetical protein
MTTISFADEMRLSGDFAWTAQLAAAQTEAYAEGRADQLREDVARLRELDAEAKHRHNYFGFAALVLLEKQ